MSNFIEEIVQEDHPDCWEEVMELELVEYLVTKTRSVHSSSKARASFGSIYAIYVLVEDYVNRGFATNPEGYRDYEGMRFTDAFRRQRELPFGEKLQNHALNHRCNQEFLKFFPDLEAGPIVRDPTTKRYSVNDDLLLVRWQGEIRSVAHTVLRIVDRYVELKREAFEGFFEKLRGLVAEGDDRALEEMITEQLSPEVDARIFEIVSYAVVKLHCEGSEIWVGRSAGEAKPVPVLVYKTGRTNANDGGIDFIMQPFGRIFQVTEVLDFDKYFLDIDKVNRFPITFVVKSAAAPEAVMESVNRAAERKFGDAKIRDRYLACFEEIITIPVLASYLEKIVEGGRTPELVDEVISQCKVEFNM